MRVDSSWTVFWIFILVAAPSLGQSDASVLLPVAGLVSYWPADGTPEDAIGNNDGVLRNGTSFAPGIAGQAFSLDGQDDYILVPNNITLNFGIQDFSLSLWIKTRFSGGGVGTDFLISKIQSGTILEYTLQYNSNIDGRALWAVASAGRGEYVSAGPKLGDNRWHHIVGVRRGTEILLYIDCMPVARSGCFGCTVMNSIGPSNVAIGGRENSTNDPYFAGLIDEVVIYGRALSDTEIKEVYRGTSGMRCPEETSPSSSIEPAG